MKQHITTKQHPDRQYITSETALQQSTILTDNTSPVKQHYNNKKSRQTIHHQ
jgi:hypothetical protein